MDAMEALTTRRSVRKYKQDAVPAELIEKVVDAGRLAASARNVQPWEFVVVINRQMRAELAEICEYGKFISESPACIVTFCHDTKYYLEDGSAAMQNMLVAAAALGLGTCWVAGDKKPYARTIAEKLGVPPDCRLIGLVALGHPADTGQRAPKRALSEVLHLERW